MFTCGQQAYADYAQISNNNVERRRIQDAAVRYGRSCRRIREKFEVRPGMQAPALTLDSKSEDRGPCQTPRFCALLFDSNAARTLLNLSTCPSLALEIIKNETAALAEVMGDGDFEYKLEFYKSDTASWGCSRAAVDS